MFIRRNNRTKKILNDVSKHLYIATVDYSLQICIVTDITLDKGDYMLSYTTILDEFTVTEMA